MSPPPGALESWSQLPRPGTHEWFDHKHTHRPLRGQPLTEAELATAASEVQLPAARGSTELPALCCFLPPGSHTGSLSFWRAGAFS